MAEQDRPTAEAGIVLGCFQIGDTATIIGYNNVTGKPVLTTQSEISKVFTPNAAESVAIFLKTEPSIRTYNDGQIIIPETIHVGKIIDQKDSAEYLTLDYIEFTGDETNHRVDEKTVLQALLDSLENPFTETQGNPAVTNELARREGEEMFLPVIPVLPQYGNDGSDYLVCSLPNEYVGISNYGQVYRAMLVPILRGLLINDLMQEPNSRKGYVDAICLFAEQAKPSDPIQMLIKTLLTQAQQTASFQIDDEAAAMKLADKLLFQHMGKAEISDPVLDKDSVIMIVKGMLNNLNERFIDQMPTPQRVALQEKRRLEQDFGTDIEVPDAPWYITDEFIERARGMGFALAYFPPLDIPNREKTTPDDFMRYIRTHFPHWLEPNQYKRTHYKEVKSFGITDQYWQAIYNGTLSFQKNGFWGFFEMRDGEGRSMSRTNSKAKISRSSNEYIGRDGSHKLISELGLLGRGWVCVPDVYQINLIYNQEGRNKTQWRRELTSSRSDRFGVDSVVYYSGTSLDFIKVDYDHEFPKDDYRLFIKLVDSPVPPIESDGGDNTT